jgi:hypothetical protein
MNVKDVLAAIRLRAARRRLAQAEAELVRQRAIRETLVWALTVIGAEQATKGKGAP